MLSAASLPIPPTPTWPEVYSGIPSRLAHTAAQTKEKIYAQRTLPLAAERTQVEELPILPPETTRAKFNEAVAELRKDIGERNVELNDKPLIDGWYMEHPNTHDAFHILEQDDTVSSATVYPGSTEEVQTIVRWANKYLIPIYPISMGRNLGYGGAAPRIRGAVVVDLGRRMDKVLKIDPDNCSCLVEPGVSYYALYEAVQATGYPLWIDTPDLGGGSVLGNAVDRGVGYTPYGDHFGCHCGMEVVLPTGEVVRTGMGALPGKDGADNPCWQSFQYGYGPYSDGIFTQSNFGIVTKMGFWLMPETDHTSYMITFRDEDQYPEIMSTIRPLAINKVLGNVPQLRHVIQELAVTGKPKKFFYDGPGQIPREVIRKWAKDMPCGDCSWVFYGTVYGPDDFRKGQLEIIRREFGKIDGSRLMLPEELPEDHYLHSRVSVCSGVPVLRELDWLNWMPNGAHLFFAPIAPTSGEDVKRLFELCRKRHDEYGIDLFPTLCVASRESHVIVNLVYDRSSKESKKAAYDCLRAMIADAAAEGYGEYRTHILFSDQVAGTYNWNNNALMRMNEALKDALDPNGILAPGKNGIWPKRFRGKGWEIFAGDQRTSSLPAIVKDPNQL
ncbi:vanillyl alcohol oxidase [Calocera viscosa TUFC12733]|uniref:Vanillyl alcohol oxidase n=1 Tax=Calocera viscosa (strain TUFC12733) TaxID=1330018 RepID=A0A167LK23_CALVF|nr:vanillyl alcohol oxidase [Calocera viscosa TUFC12733]